MNEAEGNAVVLGNGFIGSAVAAAMIENFRSVRIIARTPRKRDAHLLGVGVQIDYAKDAHAYWQIVSDRATKSDTLFSGIGTASPGFVENNYTQELRGALTNVHKIAHVSNHNPNLRLIHVSSGGCVYGESPGSGSRESDQTSPIGKYGHLHVEVEKSLAQEIRHAADRVLVVRVSNPYGSAQIFTQGLGFVAYASQQIGERKPVNLLAGGKQIRDYIHIDDVGSSIARLAKARDARGTFNIGTGVGTSNREMAELLSQILNETVEFTNLPRRPFDVQQNILNNERIVSEVETDFPSLEDGLRKSLARHHLNAQ
jgi:UDP-glucose 4-epimerase